MFMIEVKLEDHDGIFTTLFRGDVTMGNLAIRLTPVTTICSIWGHGRLAEQPAGVRGMVRHGRRLPSVSAANAMARGLPVPPLRRGQLLADEAQTVPLHPLRAADLAACRHDLSRQPQAVAVVVSSNVARHLAEVRG